jgi:hypothetical protein
VGYGILSAAAGRPHDTHALLWRGTAASAVDLHPGQLGERNSPSPGSLAASVAVATCLGQQVGYGSEPGDWDTRALLWRGSADSVVDLHPHSGVTLGDRGAPILMSRILATSGEQHVGIGQEGATSGMHLVPLLWRSSALSAAGRPNVVVLPIMLGDSNALGASTDGFVGFGHVWPTEVTHALLWRGSSASAVADLHPKGFISSKAVSISGDQQVGYGSGPATGGQNHALLWRGSAASVVDLHPSGFFYSRALGTNGDEQVGWGDQHALLWHGTAASVVDLHSFLPPGFVTSLAADIDTAWNVVGTAWGPASGGRYHAFLWKRNGPKPVADGRRSNTRCGSP